MFQSNQSQKNNEIAYIVTQNFNSPHIEQLVQVLEKNKVPNILQKQTDTLGEVLNHRFFVVVDNIQGPVRLGPEFSSLYMFIVGFPKKGANKKNHYCQKPEQVIKKYEQFRKLPELQPLIMQTSLVKSRATMKSANSVKSVMRSRVSSTLVHERSNSISENSGRNSIKLKSITYYGSQKNKVFMLLAKNQQENIEKVKYANKYNKNILKIASSDPNIFKIIEELSQLTSYQQSGAMKGSLLVVMDSDISHIKNSINQNWKIVVYCVQGICDKVQDSYHYCQTPTDLVQIIKKFGFNPSSMKNVLKSIIKQSNPYKPQKVLGKSKKLIWDESPTDSNQNKNQLKISIVNNEQIQQSKVKVFTGNRQQITKPESKTGSNSTPNSSTSIVDTHKSQCLVEVKAIPFTFSADSQNSITSRQNKIKNIQPNISIINIENSKNNQVPSLLATDNKVNIMRIKSKDSNSQLKKSVKKVKRVKSTNQSEIKGNNIMAQLPSVPKIMYTNQSTKQQSNKIINKIVLPQQYYTPVSPASEQFKIFQNNVKAKIVSKKVLRSQSTQPIFHNINAYQTPKYGRQVQKIDAYDSTEKSSNKKLQSSQLINNSASKQTIIQSLKTSMMKVSSSPPLYQSDQSKDIQSNRIITYNVLPVTYNQFERNYKLANGRNSQVINSKGVTKIIAGNFQKNTTNKSEQNIIFNSWNLNSTKREEIKKDNKNTNAYPNQHLIDNQLIQNKGSLYMATKPTYNYYQNQSIPKYKIQASLNYTNVALLWKQFNFDIQQTTKNIKQELIKCFPNLSTISFLKDRQLASIIEKLKNSKIVIITDDVQLQNNLQSIYKSVLNLRADLQIVSIYVCPKVSYMTGNQYFSNTYSLKHKTQQRIRRLNINYINSMIKTIIFDSQNEQSSIMASQIHRSILSSLKSQ